MDGHKRWIGEAIRLATEARERGDEPFGALLVVDDLILVEARNAIITTKDVTQHAETRLISRATPRFDRSVLERSTLYTSTEPCAMCSGAIYWSGVRHIVYGFPADRLEGLVGGSGIHRSSREVLGDATGRILIEGPVDEEAASEPHRDFW